ncbi:hypothetical protein HanRHA438_Chr10g0465221 [Helianthus annuus]|uniref:Uncharacterized protein n=1 Tax=Helianthus annuus TaxID=4232 RepID=A0A251TN75_HELAN|nr:hypothetical protein HanRHA438_Chr10g0465221 [Helianthus annuus]
MLILMLTGLDALMIAVPLQVIASFLDPTLSVGIPRNNTLLFVPAQRQSIEHWPTQLQRFVGLCLSCMSFRFLLLVHLLFGVTTMVSHI